MNAIGDDLGVSERHRRRVFRDAVGVGPKAFAELAGGSTDCTGGPASCRSAYPQLRDHLTAVRVQHAETR
ncbi:hypothetical protein WMF26_12815 [Sorangium sp. So ce185]|uniref:hypothetical protein n=1 Tax=Sorangium sp. So ce185 TaxID=3133287 RepID=UPI003F603B35